jgi:hypothetical protein
MQNLYAKQPPGAFLRNQNKMRSYLEESSGKYKILAGGVHAEAEEK